jgi:hypothetical protein
MQKRIIDEARQDAPLRTEPDWLMVEELAEAELSSEDPGHPIEAALLAGRGSGWRASSPGPQTIRLRFKHPQHLRRVALAFCETSMPRTQTYLLRWSADGGRSFRDIVRQQWTFSPPGTTLETEDHEVDLPSVTVLELRIVPDISGGNALASLAQLRLA